MQEHVAEQPAVAAGEPSAVQRPVDPSAAAATTAQHSDHHLLASHAELIPLAVPVVTTQPPKADAPLLRLWVRHLCHLHRRPHAGNAQ